MNSIQVGNEAETKVCEYLENLGYRITCRNFRTREGEIDIIALINGTICAVEVKKFPSTWDIADIKSKIPMSKVNRIKKTLSVYLANCKECKYDEIRFDVAAVIDGLIHYWEGAF